MADIKKQYKTLKELLGDKRDLMLTDEQTLRCQDVLQLLEARGYIHNINADGMNWYRKMAEWDGFEDWLNEELKAEKRISRREWIIGLIGAAIGLIPFIISLFID